MTIFLVRLPGKQCRKEKRIIHRWIVRVWHSNSLIMQEPANGSAVREPANTTRLVGRVTRSKKEFRRFAFDWRARTLLRDAEARSGVDGPSGCTRSAEPRCSLSCNRYPHWNYSRDRFIAPSPPVSRCTSNPPDTADSAGLRNLFLAILFISLLFYLLFIVYLLLFIVYSLLVIIYNL